MDKILILDYGSQYTQLIGRRVRAAGVYAEIIAGDSALDAGRLEGVRGIVLSGSPFSVYDGTAPRPDGRLWDLEVPILGICYGAQRMTSDLGGRVEKLADREYGRMRVDIEAKGDPLVSGLPASISTWMSHGDSISAVAPGFQVLARSEAGIPAIVRRGGRKQWGVQFHPEVSHCEGGPIIVANFARSICGMEGSWSMEGYREEISRKLRDNTGDRDVLLLISGGVDSSVAGALLLSALPPEKVWLLYIDTGLMRKDESLEVMRNLKGLGARHLHMVDAGDEFLSALSGQADPEAKRRIIGDLFMEVQKREVERLGIPDSFLVQGTLYTDLIESGKGVGTKAQVIKSHHNVRSPLVEAKRGAGMIIEPLDRLYKDEVRELGRLLGLGSAIVDRHPFPGPGLAVRILGEVTREACDLLREADAVYLDELRSRGLYGKIWQAFSVLLPTRSVGVAGDERKYGRVLALRAVVSEDGMTAEPFAFDMKDLTGISAAITNRVPGIGRVVYDISSKPPATIEWE
ncbi:MAG: glutamine-hydrolyzing GMP synthase [Treponema sp.]|nr:glutamine-hydrolyzing GMP synthase [Treponema sp.]